MGFETIFRILHRGFPLNHLLTIDINDFQELDSRLSSFKESLSESLEGTRADDSEEDAVVARPRLMAQLRLLYMQLRLYRPLLILGLALSRKCVYRPNGEPHMTGGERFSLKSPLVLGLIRNGSFKCWTAAVSLLGLLWRHKTDNGPRDDLGGGFFGGREYPPFVCMRTGVHRNSHDSVCRRRRQRSAVHDSKDRQSTIHNLESLSDKVNTLFHDYENSSRRGAKLSALAASWRKALSSLHKAAGDANNPGVINDRVVFKYHTWRKLYARLNVDLPASMSRSEAETPSPAPSSMLFGWLESLPVDLD